MKEEKNKELYDAPKAVFLPLDNGQSVLVTFSLEFETEDITEDNNEW